MPSYFNFFPKVLVDTSERGKDQIPDYEVLTNITARIALLKAIKNNTLDFYLYPVKDSDTPEIVASKIYGDPEKHWVILAANDMIDPNYDWPMDYGTFIKFVSNKYDSLANAESGIHHYTETISTTDSTTGTVTNQTFVLDAGTYANTPVDTVETFNLVDGTTVHMEITTDAVTNYEHEFELNEAKRQIKIIRPELISRIQQEFVALMAIQPKR